jgi:hypothetical protein
MIRNKVQLIGHLGNDQIKILMEEKLAILH